MSEQRWFTCQELADLQLPAIATTKRRVLDQAEREGWECRAREGRGGGREYYRGSLPEAARIELGLRAIQPDNPILPTPRQDQRTLRPGPAPRPASGAGSASLAIAYQNSDYFLAVNHTAPKSPSVGPKPEPGETPSPTHAQGPRAQSRAAARLVILNLLRQFKDEGGLSMIGARQAFAALFNAGEIPVEAWVQGEVGRLTVRSLERWGNQAAKEGAARLGGKYGTRKGKGQIDSRPELRDFCVANMAARPHLTAYQLQQAIGARFGIETKKRTVQRFMASARERYADAFLRAANPDAHKNLRLVAFGSQSEKASALNEVWEIDASPADIMTIEGKRLTLVAMVDVYSRRAKVLVTPTPKATAATLLMRNCILDWGVPQRIKMDNGKDFASAHVARALGSLLIQQDFCPPFTPEGKPHVERFFQTLQHEFVSLLPGFVGHNVMDRKAIEARRSFAQRFGNPEGAIAVELSAVDLQARIDEWVERIYHKRPHSSLGTTPQLKAVDWPGAVSKIENPRALDVLLAEAPDTAGLRVVGKKGVRVEATHFIAPELGGHVGERVHVRLDPADMGRIMVYSEAGDFICVAEAPERTGMNREEVAAKAKAIQKEAVREAAADLRRLQREHKPHRIAEEILAAARDDQVIAFPRRAETHDVPALDAAADAARHLDRTPEPPRPLSRDDEDLAAEAEARVIDLQPRAQAAEPQDDWEWFCWAREHEGDLKEGQRELYESLKHDPAIKLRLAHEEAQRSGA